MTLKRGLTAILVLAVGVWVAYVSLSLWRVGDSLASLEAVESPAVQSTADSDPSSSSPSPNAEESAPEPIGGEALPERESDEEAVADNRFGLPVDPNLLVIDGRPIDPYSIQFQCENNWSGFGIYMDEEEKSISAIGSLSDEEMQAFVDAGNHGYAQFLYGERLLGIQRTIVPREWANTIANAATQAQSPNGSSFPLAKEYFIKAIQNHNIAAAFRLGEIYQHFDRVEAQAWFLIARRSGDTAFAQKQSVEEAANPFTELEKAQGEFRAEDLIAEHDLARGLRPPEPCLQ